MQVADSNVLVTGASSGIGAALAEALSARGAAVGIVGRRREKLEAVRAACGGRARSWVVDLGDVDAAQRLALEAWDELGGLDVLVNNAAIPKRRAGDPSSRLAEVEETMRVNFLSPVAHDARHPRLACWRGARA